jgi:hypothetical protein
LTTRPISIARSLPILARNDTALLALRAARPPSVRAHSQPRDGGGDAGGMDPISAVTLATHDMNRATRFYRSLGFRLPFGSASKSFAALLAVAGCCP